MKTVVQDESYGRILYEENIWTGKKYISINAQPLSKLDKKTYRYTKSNGETVDFKVKGNFFTGVALVAFNARIQVVRKTNWFEWLFFILTLCVAFVWGNSVTLCKIFPVAGGAIGGCLGVLCGMFPVFIAKLINNKWLQALCGLIGFLAIFLAGHLTAIIFAFTLATFL